MIVRVMQYVNGTFHTAIATRNSIWVRGEQDPQHRSYTWGRWYGDHSTFPFGFDVPINEISNYDVDIRFGYVPAAIFSIFKGRHVEEEEVADSDFNALKAVIFSKRYCSTGGTGQSSPRAYIVTDEKGYPIIERLPEYKTDDSTT